MNYNIILIKAWLSPDRWNHGILIWFHLNPVIQIIKKENSTNILADFLFLRWSMNNP